MSPAANGVESLPRAFPPAPVILAAALLGLVPLLAQEPSPAGVARLAIGEPVTGRLESGDVPLSGHGPSKTFEWAAEADGPVTASLESLDFDAFLRVETSAGETIGEDEDGGVETDARLTFDAKRGSRFRVVAAAPTGAAGEFRLTLATGALGRPTGGALLEAGIAHRAAAAERALARGDKKAALLHRIEEASRRFSRSQFREAEGVYDVALSLAREVGDTAEVGKILVGLGHVHFRLGDDAKARDRYQEALALAQETGDRVLERRALASLGNVHGRLGDYPQARELYERSLALARELGDRRAEAMTLGNLGIVYYYLGDYAKAREHHERNLASAREAGDRAGEATVLANLADVEVAVGNLEKAREHNEKRLSLAREIGDRAQEASALGGSGTIHSRLGDFRTARARYEVALRLAREIGDRGTEVVVLGNLGTVHCSLGDFATAREHFEASLAAARELGHRVGEILALGNLGVVHHFLGDYRKSRKYHDESLRLARQIGNRASEARALGGLGNVCLSLGDYPGARERYEEWLALAREIGDRSAEAMALANRADVDHLLGDHRKAREGFEEWLALVREIGDRMGEAEALGNLGAVCVALGEPGSAREYADAALRLWREVGSEEGVLFPLVDLARLAVAERDPAAALAALEQAGSFLERPSVRRLESSESAGLRARFSEVGRLQQDLASLRAEAAREDDGERSSAVADGFRDAGRWKGRALLEGIAEHRAGGRSAQALALRREWREALAQRDGILQRVSELIRGEEALDAIEALRGEALAEAARAEGLAERLRAISPRDAALDLPVGAAPEAVRAALGKGCALLEYAEGDERLYAYLLTESTLSLHVLGERKAIDGEVSSFLEKVADPASPGTVGSIASEGRALFDRLLAPVLTEAGEGLERLVLVPTPSLAALPFEALVAGTSGPGEPRSFAELEFVLDRYEVSYAPSSPVLVELLSLGPRRERGEVLLLADPRYASEPDEGEEAAPAEDAPLLAAARAVPEPGMFTRLPKTREEALAIAGLLAKREKDAVAAELARQAGRRSASLDGEAFDLYLGAEASRARLAGDLRRYSVLHLAAHGFVDPEVPQRSGLALSFEEGEDGYFSIGDALELDLDANLVVLSACETARGEARAGEGVESLARAFMYAGSRAVVASLWQVEERAAAETMRAFYEGALERRLEPSTALRKAKLALRRSRTMRGVGGVRPGDSNEGQLAELGHPFFWAPFIYVGLPR